MTHRATRALLRKEVRALGPLWAGCTAAVAAAPLTHGGPPLLSLAPVLVFVLGSIALGAHAAGHEITYRTLEQMLAQPISRRRVLLVKAVVLAACLSTLAAMAGYSLSDYRGLFAGLHREWALIGASALLIAPALTLLARNTIAGVVFTVGIAGMLKLAADIAGALLFGSGESAAIDAFARSAYAPALTALAVAAGAAVFVLFMRQEAIDDRAAPITFWPSRSGVRNTASVHRHPHMHLLAKELHLHQMAFVLAALFAAGFVLHAVVRNVRSLDEPWVLEPLAVLYVLAMPLLIGSFAIAEERQFGMMEGQLLAPIAPWKPWSLKIGVALALALLLAIAVPMMVAVLYPALASELRMSRLTPLVVVLLGAFSLWISSLSGSGIRALLIVLPSLVGMIVFVQWLAQSLDGWRIIIFRAPRFVVVQGYVLTAGVILSAVLLALASRNYRSEERTPRRVLGQCALVAACTAAVVAIAVVFL